MTDEEKYVDMILQTKDWYDKKIKSLQQIVDLKDDSKILIQSDDGKEIQLPEEDKKGFILGLILAIDILGEFPINITKT
jgi:hypothetical protein